MAGNSKTITAGDVIRRAVRYIEEKGWTQETYAKDATGQWVDACDPHATSFCMLGALCRAKVDLAVNGWPLPIYPIQLALNDGHISQWNDDPKRTKTQVLVVLRRAANLPESRRPIWTIA